METLKMRQVTFKPRSNRNISLVETFFSALGLDYSETEIDDFNLSKGQTEKILKGIEDAENGRVLTSQTIYEKTARWRK